MSITGRLSKTAPRLGLVLMASAECVAAGASPMLDVSRTAIAYGRVAAGVEYTQPLFLTNVGNAPLTLSGFPVTGKDRADYRVGGTCGAPLVLPPGGRCRLDVIANFASTTSSATLTIQSDSASGATGIPLSGLTANDLLQGLIATPPWIDFDHQPLGTTSVSQTLTITNPERAALALTLDSVGFSGKDARDFSLVSDCVVGGRYSTNEGCSATIAFTPSADGPRSTEIVFSLHPGFATAGYVTLAYSVTGVGGAAVPVDVVEYYNATLDHYFITWLAAEQANLDAGKTPTRWVRTGFSFHAYTSAQAGTSPVCRYYLPPAFGDSHFFGRGTAECNATGVAHPAFVLEDPGFMQMILPTAGACPAATKPVYRVFSNRPDANHRYMTDRAIRDQMVAKGWLAEGDGPDLVVMCAP